MGILTFYPFFVAALEVWLVMGEVKEVRGAEKIKKSER